MRPSARTVGADCKSFQDYRQLPASGFDANVFEKDLDRVKIGQGARLSVPAIPGVVFSGKVIFVSSVVDPETPR
jgi:hypothetical protein